MENTIITKWMTDPSHSEILFKVKHLMITNVKGEFRKFNVEVSTENNDFTKANAHVTIEASSVFTNNDDRDAHLRSADFFDTENHQFLSFTSTGMKKIDAENFRLSGLLTIRGVSKEIMLNVEFGGINKDPWGNEKAGFSVTGTINRKDWGLNWNAALDAGGVLVSDEVKISCEIQLVRKP